MKYCKIIKKSKNLSSTTINLVKNNKMKERLDNKNSKKIK